MMFLISIFFLSLIYETIEVVLLNQITVILFMVKSLVLIVLGLLSFGVYLSVQNKKSIWFLTGVVCLGFSAIFDYFNIYFLNEWRFFMGHKLLYVTGIYFAFKYDISNNSMTTIRNADQDSFQNNIWA
ncbi:hypothetical protein VOI54_11650 [Tamlana sp. 2201CG12-4]|uniref:hypothetical protein n=1 Tax=Tamlana sp. 2201CG12-4 TaxID=3112582 RepID=UPI002DB93202|nr:hypothetical protein [Tamlana sp. 2201CG12-4]MEC3907675.1 hypothetical protein [Tamlana sp. 2201CG12-4]